MTDLQIVHSCDNSKENDHPSLRSFQHVVLIFTALVQSGGSFEPRERCSGRSAYDRSTGAQQHLRSSP